MRANDYENPIEDILTGEEQPVEWLIPHIMLQGAFVCLAGDAGTGKSYVSYTISLALAGGVSALSGIVPKLETPKRVLYFDQENSTQDRNKYLRRAYLGLCATGDNPDIDLLVENFIPVHFSLGDENWFDIAREYVQMFQPHLMVFDTTTPSFDIQDENSNSEASQIIKKVRQLMALPNQHIATALALRHAKIRNEANRARTMRGAKTWVSATDSTMYQVKVQGRPRKDGLCLTRLLPDKTRAYGLDSTIYITPRYTDDRKTGLVLDGSYSASALHQEAERREDDDDEDGGGRRR